MEENEELKELAELEKQEMESQYRDFDVQYEMLQNQLSNDSLIAQIENERRHTQQLLEELERTKATDAAEIKRLKAEIASLRAVLQSYIMQVDSLNRLNQSLNEENTQIKTQMAEQTAQITNLSTERNQLKDKVNIAAQLDATGFWVTPKNKRSKDTQKVKDVKRLAFGFTIVKNVTAENGQRTVYARILKPDNSVMGPKGTFPYEGTSVEYTERKAIDYTGEEVRVTMYSDVTEFLEAGTYRIFIFCDDEFHDAYLYTPFIILSVVYTCFSTFMGSVYVASKKTVRSLVTAAIGAGVNIILNLIMIALWGIIGATIASFLSFAVIFIVRAVDTHSIVYMDLGIRKMTVNFLLILGMGMVIFFVHDSELLFYGILAFIFLLITVINFKAGVRAIKVILKKEVIE